MQKISITVSTFVPKRDGRLSLFCVVLAWLLVGKLHLSRSQEPFFKLIEPLVARVGLDGNMRKYYICDQLWRYIIFINCENMKYVQLLMK